MKKGGKIPLKDWYVDLESFSVQAKTYRKALKLAINKLTTGEHTPRIDSIGVLDVVEE
jgi:hypothetical protein